MFSYGADFGDFSSILLFGDELKILLFAQPLHPIILIIGGIPNFKIDQPLDPLIIVTLLKPQQINNILHIGTLRRIEVLIDNRHLLHLINPIHIPEDFRRLQRSKLFLVELDSVASVPSQFVDVGVVEVEGVFAGEGGEGVAPGGHSGVVQEG